MIRSKIDVVAALRNVGYPPTRIRVEKIFGERVMTKFRRGELPSHAELDKLCRLLCLQPGDILEYVPDDTQE